MAETIYIATILTCFNRKDKTVECLRKFYEVCDSYNLHNADGRILDVSVFLTDDGCTDGTARVVKDISSGRDLHIVQGTGSLYWAGGMRAAWRVALEQGRHWQYYLLLNDDNIVMYNLFEQLFAADNYSLDVYGKQGVYSGITCDTKDNSIITYGGDVFTSGARCKTERVRPTGMPQMVDMANANIMFVPSCVVEKIGIFYDGYIHSGADNDYSMLARRQGFTVLVTGQACGLCDYDHREESDICKSMIGMTLAQRRAYVNNPLHSDHDYLLLVWRNNRKKYLASWILRKTRLYFPKLYFILTMARGVY